LLLLQSSDCDCCWSARTRSSSRNANNWSLNFVERCMDAKGYSIVRSDFPCQDPSLPRQIYESCYIPRSVLDALALKIQLAIGRIFTS